MDLEIGSDNQHLLTDSLVEDYILRNFKFTNDSEVIPMIFIGLEYDYDITYLYIESDTFDIKTNGALGVSVFFELFPDQENIVDYQEGETEQSLIFTTQERKIAIIVSD